MLLYIREEELPYRMTVIYSNRDRESTAFLDELRELEQQIPDCRLVLTMTQDPNWEGENAEGRRTVFQGLSSTTTSTSTRFSSPARPR